MAGADKINIQLLNRTFKENIGAGVFVNDSGQFRYAIERIAPPIGSKRCVP